MGMTMVEKILADHADRDQLQPGEFVNARVDIVLGNDITAPVAIREFEKLDLEEVFDRERVVLVPDHFTPNKDIASAEQCRLLRDFAETYGLTNYFEIGEMGIEHVLLPEKGLVGPGDIVIGADSHTCTYGALGALATGVGSTDMAAGMALGEAWFRVPETIKITYSGELPETITGKDLILATIATIGVDGARYRSIEFSGEVLSELEMSDRFTMANMAIEAGAKCGLFVPDQKTLDYVEGRARRPYRVFRPDEDAEYEREVEIEVTDLEPQVAFPHLPENARPIGAVLAGDVIPIDQVVIGSCTNGRLEDLRLAAEILRGNRVKKGLRLIVIPGSQEVYRQALRQGLIAIFLEAGAAVSTPTCGPCLGGHMGILAAGERAVATTNRNFVGRMGHPESEVYLAAPHVAAATAVMGRIASPEEVE